jgi:hypothetical protein
MINEKGRNDMKKLTIMIIAIFTLGCWKERAVEYYDLEIETSAVSFPAGGETRELILTLQEPETYVDYHFFTNTFAQDIARTITPSSSAVMQYSQAHFLNNSSETQLVIPVTLDDGANPSFDIDTDHIFPEYVLSIKPTNVGSTEARVHVFYSSDQQSSITFK